MINKTLKASVFFLAFQSRSSKKRVNVVRKFSVISLVYICIIGTALAFLFPCPDVSAANEDIVYIIPVSGEITPAMAVFFKEKIAEANQVEATGIIVKITTFGGRIDSAIEMKETIIKSQVPVAVYVGERAISAGALLTIAAPKIIMAPGSHIGSAEPIPYSEKNVAFVRGEFQATAKRWGRDEKIAQAMVDKNIEIPGLSPKGSLLDINADTAYQYGYADAVLEGRENVLDYLGFDNMSIIEVIPSLQFHIAQFLTRSDVASVLLTIGVIAILAELFIQGFGLPGIIGIASLALYFGGSFLAGYAEWWAIALFLIGGILLLSELYVPGGILGAGGIVCMAVGMVLAAPDPIQGIEYIGVALAAAIVVVPILFYLFGRIKAFDKFVLTDTVVEEDKGYIDIGDQSKLLGKTGTVISALRPSGSAQIDGVKMEVISDGEFLLPGTRIKVIKIEGISIVVTRDE